MLSRSSSKQALAGLGQSIGLLSLLAVFAGTSASQATEPSRIQWFDLLTEDAAAATSFYAKLFDWKIERSPSGAWIALRNGSPIAGISQIEDTLPEIDESTWLAAIVVADLDAVVDEARNLGATIEVEITTVEGYGRYSVIRDPQGAPVMLATTERPLGGTRGAGAWVWAELWTDDPGAASSFYSKVAGFQASELDRPQGPYPVLTSGEQPRAGLVEITREGIEPGWAPYLGVQNISKTIKRASRLGGTVLMAASSELADGRVALLADPTGGAFFIYQIDEVSR